MGDIRGREGRDKKCMTLNLDQGQQKAVSLMKKKVCKKFNNWKEDEDAKLWLKIMGYDLNKIDYVKAIQIPTRIKKSDVKKFRFSEEEYEDLMHFKKQMYKSKLG